MHLVQRSNSFPNLGSQPEIKKANSDINLWKGRLETLNRRYDTLQKQHAFYFRLVNHFHSDRNLQSKIDTLRLQFVENWGTVENSLGEIQENQVELYNWLIEHLKTNPTLKNRVTILQSKVEDQIKETESKLDKITDSINNSIREHKNAIDDVTYDNSSTPQDRDDLVNFYTESAQRELINYYAQETNLWNRGKNLRSFLQYLHYLLNPSAQ